MSLQRIIFVFVLLCFFDVNDFHVEGTLSSAAKTHRIQSKRLLTSRKAGNNLQAQHAQSDASLSASSTSSLTELKAADSQPIASTSNGVQIDSMSFKEVDLQAPSMVDGIKHIRFIHSIDLSDASRVTQNIDGNINPARDGVFARVRKAMLRYGSAAAIGSAIGVTGVELKKKLLLDNANNVENTTTIDSIEITNPL